MRFGVGAIVGFVVGALLVLWVLVQVFLWIF